MKHKRHFSGQSLLEFALIFPLVALLVIGFFDLGRAVFYYSSLSNAVREASRDGIVMAYANFPTREAFIAYLEDQVEDYGFGLNDIIVDVTFVNKPDSEFIEKVEVTGIYCFNPVTPMITNIIGAACSNGTPGFDLNAVSVMQMEPGTR